jgi:hypothetical protein
VDRNSEVDGIYFFGVTLIQLETQPMDYFLAMVALHFTVMSVNPRHRSTSIKLTRHNVLVLSGIVST